LPVLGYGRKSMVVACLYGPSMIAAGRGPFISVMEILPIEYEGLLTLGFLRT